MKKILNVVAAYLAIGFLIVCGMRAAEWLLPEPPVEFFVCFLGVDDEKPVCRNLYNYVEQRSKNGV